MVIDVPVKLKHPVRTGRAVRDGRLVPVSEPVYLTAMALLDRDQRIGPRRSI
jgi:hypothetical protein